MSEITRPLLLNKPTITGPGRPATFLLDADDPITEGIETREGGDTESGSVVVRP